MDTQSPLIDTNRRVSSPAVRELQRSLRRAAEEEVQLALRVAVLLGMGCSYRQIADTLGCTMGDVTAARGRLRRAGEVLA